MQARNLGPTAAAEPSARVVVERPPPGLQRGRAAGPRWLLAALAAFTLLLVSVFYLRRVRRGRAR